MSRDSESRLFHEVTGLFLLGLGTLLFLALISYDIGDVPSWFPFASGTETNASLHNFAGKIGAMVACTAYLIFGAASYLIAAIVLGFGAVKLMRPGARVARKLPWVVLFIISATCLLQLQTVAFQDWQQIMKVRPGGEIGYWLIGDEERYHWVKTLFGGVGSLVLFGVIYVASLILMTGIHPIVVVRRAVAQVPLFIARYREWKLQRDLARADERERLILAQKELEREQKRLERQISKRGGKGGNRRGARDEAEAAAPREEPEPEAESGPEFDPNRPAPKVIDTTAAPPPRRAAPLRPEKSVAPDLTDPLLHDDYQLPGVDLLDELDEADRGAGDKDEMLETQATLIDTLEQFGIAVAAGDITRGPTITRYEVYPAKGVRVDKIVALERDLARATRAERINILAPIPGKDTVGIEIANSRKQKVTLGELLKSDDWENTNAKIPLVLGKDVYGKTILGDLASMPHLLVAGTTGSGKSVCINSIIASILYRFSPNDLRFIMIDPKVVEMQVYNALPHLAIPVVTDPKKVLLALRWVIDEMEKRYKIFAKAGVRNIATFNARPKPKSQRELDEELEAAEAAAEAEAEAEAAHTEADAGELAEVGAERVVEGAVVARAGHGEGEAVASVDGAERAPWDEGAGGEAPVEAEAEAEAETEAAVEEEEPPRPPIRVRRDDDIEIPEGPMSYIVVIIDELADLMQTAPADVESAIARITQMARAAGIHMIVATQTPRADVITGVIKANIPTRIAFQVASALDSRIILDEKGAERLLGQGDMMYVPPGTSRMTRAQGVFVTDDEIRRLVEFAARQGEPDFDNEINERISGSGSQVEELTEEEEELVQKCIEIMIQERKASASLFQRRLRLGYSRAARIMDILEERRYVGPGDGAKPREILVDLDELI